MRPVRLLLALCALLLALPISAQIVSAQIVSAQTGRDWITDLPRETVPVKTWPGGKKVAVAFVLYVEVWGKGHGPNFRPDMTGRSPDLVDEAFRQYAIEWGVNRVGRLFREQNLPLTLALSSQFPEKRPDMWKALRAVVPKASIVAHGMNNSTDQLPLGKGPEPQRAYIRAVLDSIEKSTGRRPIGWSSPSVYPDADTFAATAAEGIRYTLDGMDSDVLSRLGTAPQPLLMIPYPPQIVDMGQYLARFKEARDLERIWIDYIGELAREAAADP
ncbi:MAG TPA: polysaccharide deacetylase, partial [Reyranella sp.]|nr:polysaccharide deacetylase [Reyranella sp.]